MIPIFWMRKLESKRGDPAQSLGVRTVPRQCVAHPFPTEPTGDWDQHPRDPVPVLFSRACFLLWARQCCWSPESPRDSWKYSLKSEHTKQLYQAGPAETAEISLGLRCPVLQNNCRVEQFSVGSRYMGQHSFGYFLNI